MTHQNSSVLSTVMALVEDLFQEASALSSSFRRHVELFSSYEKMHPCQRDLVLIAVGEVVDALFSRACAEAQSDVTPDEVEDRVSPEIPEIAREQLIAQGAEVMNDAQVGTVEEKSHDNQYQSLVGNSEISKESSLQLNNDGCQQMGEAGVTMETQDAGFDRVGTFSEAVSDDLEGASQTSGKQRDSGDPKVEEDGSVSQDQETKTSGVQSFKIQDTRLLLLPPDSLGDCGAALAKEDNSSLDLASPVSEELMSNIPKLDEKPLGNFDTYKFEYLRGGETDTNEPATMSLGDFSVYCDGNSLCLDDGDLHSAFPTQGAKEFLVCDENHQEIMIISSQEDRLDESFEDGEDDQLMDVKIAGVRQDLQLTVGNEEVVEEQLSSACSTLPPEHRDPINDGRGTSAEDSQGSGRSRLPGDSTLPEEALNPDCRARAENVPIRDQTVPSLLEESDSRLYTDNDEEVSIVVKRRKVDSDDKPALPSPAINPNELRQQQLHVTEDASDVDRDGYLGSENQLVPQSSTAVFQWSHAIDYQTQQPASSQPRLVASGQRPAHAPEAEWRPSPLPPCGRKRRVGLSRRQRVAQLHRASRPPCQQGGSSPAAEHEE